MSTGDDRGSTATSTASAEGSTTMTCQIKTPETNSQAAAEGDNARLVLRLKKPKGKKKVGFTSETVDNEGLNKKKSKCCCIYEKPRMFGESSSESEDECGNCYGHGDKNHQPPSDSPPPSVPPV